MTSPRETFSYVTRCRQSLIESALESPEQRSTHESLRYRTCIGGKPSEAAISENTTSPIVLDAYSGPSSVCRQSKLSGTMLSRAMSMSSPPRNRPPGENPSLARVYRTAGTSFSAMILTSPDIYVSYNALSTPLGGKPYAMLTWIKVLVDRERCRGVLST